MRGNGVYTNARVLRGGRLAPTDNEICPLTAGLDVTMHVQVTKRFQLITLARGPALIAHTLGVISAAASFRHRSPVPASPQPATLSSLKGLACGLLGLQLLVIAPVFGAEGDSIDQKGDDFNVKWSKRTLQLADGLDSFFGNQRIDDDAQQTRVRIRIDAGYDEDDGGSLGASVSARLSLPRAEDRWAIIIGDLDADDDEDTISDEDSQPSGGIGLRFTPKSDLRKQFSFDVGIRRPDDKYELYGRVRHRHTIPHKRWSTRFDNKLWLYSSFGWEFDGNIYFERPIPEKFFFRSRTRFRWWEDEDECNEAWCPEQRFTVFQRLNSPKHALAYEWFSFFETDPADGSSDHLERTYLRLRYRHMTRWDWLFIEYRPRVNFKREDDYDATFDIIVRFESIFGYRPEFQTVRFGPEENIKLPNNGQPE